MTNLRTGRFLILLFIDIWNYLRSLNRWKHYWSIWAVYINFMVGIYRLAKPIPILDYLRSSNSQRLRYFLTDRPVTYLYNTLHYYERKLQDRPPLKRKLVNAILSPFCESRSPGWSLSEQYLQYMQVVDNPSWTPELDYYINLIRRLVDSILFVCF